VSSRPKKKKKTHITREDDLSKEERTRAEIISVLCEKYIHSTPCYVQVSRYLQLINPARLQLWAREIVSYFTKLVFILIFTKLIYNNR
jgi:hypothetical protein